MSKTPPSPFQVLGVDPFADDRAFRESYLALAAQFHPDKAPEGKEEEYKSRFQNIAKAYEELSNAETRYAAQRKCMEEETHAAYAEGGGAASFVNQVFFDDSMHGSGAVWDGGDSGAGKTYYHHGGSADYKGNAWSELPDYVRTAFQKSNAGRAAYTYPRNSSTASAPTHGVPLDANRFTSTRRTFTPNDGNAAGELRTNGSYTIYDVASTPPGKEVTLHHERMCAACSGKGCDDCRDKGFTHVSENIFIPLNPKQGGMQVVRVAGQGHFLGKKSLPPASSGSNTGELTSSTRSHGDLVVSMEEEPGAQPDRHDTLCTWRRHPTPQDLTLQVELDLVEAIGGNVVKVLHPREKRGAGLLVVCKHVCLHFPEEPVAPLFVARGKGLTEEGDLFVNYKVRPLQSGTLSMTADILQEHELDNQRKQERHKQQQGEEVELQAVRPAARAPTNTAAKHMFGSTFGW